MKNTPLIIPNFNQLTYLKNLILWWRWYCPENIIYILDNNSTYKPLLDFYDTLMYPKEGSKDNIVLIPFSENACATNLAGFLDANKNREGFEYYVISDPDIMPHPNTPPNFLEVWRDQIDNHKYHRAGFNLITKDIPEWFWEKEMVLYNEGQLLNTPIMSYGPFMGYKAPIDTTFCLYKASNGGWSSPMDGENWGNCLRLFDAFHLGWYQHPDYVNEEMTHYYNTAKYRVPGEPSAGKNNNRPKQFM